MGVRQFLKFAALTVGLGACGPPDRELVADSLPDPAAAASAAPLCAADFQQDNFESPHSNACTDLLFDFQTAVDEAISAPQSLEICQVAQRLVDSIEPLIKPVDECDVCIEEREDTNITVSHCAINCSDSHDGGSSAVQKLCSMMSSFSASTIRETVDSESGI